MKVVYRVSCVFPLFFYSNDVRHFFVAHKPTKLNELLGQTRKKSDNLYDLLPWLRISDKPCVLVNLVMLREFH